MTNFLLLRAIEAESLDEAAGIIQDALGVDDGGFSSMFFEAGAEDRWPDMEHVHRYSLLRRYVDFEISFRTPDDVTVNYREAKLVRLLLCFHEGDEPGHYSAEVMNDLRAKFGLKPIAG